MTYDVIVVGARCAGSPTAMLLARMGYDVLLVDKAAFPSDTISTHMLHPPAVAALERWGLLEQLIATGCPPIDTYAIDFGPLRLSGTPQPVDGNATGYCPRRYILDELLVRAAADAGAELRESFTVEEILIEDGAVTGIRGHAAGGATVTERARVVIGADGKHSLVAKTVGAETYNEVPQLQTGYYAYWSGLPADTFEAFVRPELARGFGVMPTHDDLTVVVGGWPYAQFGENKRDYEGHYLRMLQDVPEFADRLAGATRETKLSAVGDLRGFYRKPYGPGWALVGDAGYHKDPITAFGITDAFRDAEQASAALDDAFAGRRGYDEALGGWQAARDEATLPLYGLTCEFAKMEAPPPDMIQLFGALAGDQAATDDFMSVMAATLPAPEFFGRYTSAVRE